MRWATWIHDRENGLKIHTAIAFRYETLASSVIKEKTITKKKTEWIQIRKLMVMRKIGWRKNTQEESLVQTHKFPTKSCNLISRWNGIIVKTSMICQKSRIIQWTMKRFDYYYYKKKLDQHQMNGQPRASIHISATKLCDSNTLRTVCVLWCGVVYWHFHEDGNR